MKLQSYNDEHLINVCVGCRIGIELFVRMNDVRSTTDFTGGFKETRELDTLVIERGKKKDLNGNSLFQLADKCNSWFGASSNGE